MRGVSFSSRFILSVFLLTVVRPTIAFSQDNRDALVSELEREAVTSTDPLEREYLKLCIQSASAASGQNQSELRKCKDRFLSFAEQHQNSALGARALCSAADVEATFLDDPTLARDLYSQAGALFQSHPDWSGFSQYVPYTAIRTGDSFFNTKKYEEAAKTWTETFKKNPKYDFSLQTLEKIDTANRAFLPPAEAWKTTLQTMEDFVPLVKGHPFEGAVRVKRVFVLLDGYNHDLVTADVVADAIRELLDDFDAGTNQFVDRVRTMLDVKKTELAEASATLRHASAEAAIRSKATSTSALEQSLGDERGGLTPQASPVTASQTKTMLGWREAFLSPAISGLAFFAIGVICAVFLTRRTTK